MEQCRNFKKCGGCQLPNLEYGEQLAYKQRQAEFLLGKFCRVNEIIGMENPLHYRNKATAVFFRDRRTGKTGSGIYQGNSGRIIAVDNCLIEDEQSDSIICTVRRLADSFKMKPFDLESGSGFLRHILVRRGFATNQIMVVIVTASPALKSKRSFVNALLKAHPEITTIVQSINPDGEVLTLGTESEVLFGKGYIEDELCGCKFRISPESFYQINPVQTEVLYSKAIEFAGLTGKETVFDAYCGTGTIGIIAAKAAKSAVGVEINRAAIKDAEINAENNGAENISFTCADAGDYLNTAAKNGESFDVIFMDPPRAGATLKFLKSAVKASPNKIVYISCNPKTLARDLDFLTKNGYKVKEIQPVDMFPMTKHIETVVLLSHKKPDGHINVKVEFGEGEGKVPLDNIAKRAESYKPKERVTYKMIKEYIEAKYGFKVHTAYIAEVKRDLGLPMYDAPNAVEELKQPRKHPTAEKVEAIKDALKHFEVI